MKNTIEIKVFRAGTHTASNGQVVTYNESDLSKIVDNYNNQPKDTRHEAPIIGGDHNKIGKKALGFVNKLIKKGNDLFAEILPSPELIDDVKNNRYKHVSIGLNGKGNFDHLAVLGAVNPAVKGLGMLQFTESELNEFTNFDVKKIINYTKVQIMNPQLQAFKDALQKFILETYGNDIVTAIMAKFDELLQQSGLDQPQAQAQVQPQQQGFQNLGGQNPFQQRITNQYPQFSESEDGKKLIADMVKQQMKINELEFSAYLKGEATKILPSNIDIAKELMQSLADTETNFSENNAKLDGISLFKKFVSNLPVAIDTNEIAKKELAFSQADADINKEIEKVMKGDK